MIGRPVHLSLVLSCTAVLLLSACSTTSGVDEVWEGNLEAKESDTFDIRTAQVRVAQTLENLDSNVQAIPDRITQRLAFDEEKAVKVNDDGIQVTGETVSYIINEWLPQVTGSDKRAEREAERAAKAEEELRTQVASTRNASNAPIAAQAPGTAAPFDLGQATPMASTQDFLTASARGGSGQLAATPAYLANSTRGSSATTGAAPTSRALQPGTNPQLFNQGAVSKSLSGGIEGVGRFFDQNGYTLDGIRKGALVPPVFARRLPRDMNNSVPMNKDVFLRLMLPIALKVNAEIAAERAIIERSGYSGAITGAPAEVQRIAAKYDIQSNTSNLLQRVDVLPVSLILAQSGLESGWGTSRYVQQGNALFGQRVWDSSQPGMTPSDRDADQTHRVRTFNSLEESTRSYAKNLNTNNAYLEMRKNRAAMRRSGRTPSARDLIPQLRNYSEDPTYYSGTLNTILNDGRLTDFDRARLSNGQPMNLYL